MEAGKNRTIIVGIDATRSRSGGAFGHLKGILTNFDPREYRIEKIHLWSHRELLNEIPDKDFIIKHNPPQVENGLLQSVWWQFAKLKEEAQCQNCDVMLNTDAGTVSRFSPAVTMSRDMLSYELGEIARYPFLSWTRLRLILLRYIQNRSLRMSEGVIFLTKYAARIIQSSCGPIRRLKYIPHGIGMEFFATNKSGSDLGINNPIRCLYVSPIWAFKHHCFVLDAVHLLRKKGYNIKIIFAGGGDPATIKELNKKIMLLDPNGIFVEQLGHLSHSELPEKHGESDIFVFASSCENMPSTLVEAMASGLPSACSNRGPMPEVLEDSGVYFDPEKSSEIAEAIEQLINDNKKREDLSVRANKLAAQYSWKRCANETFTFVSQVAHFK